MSALKEKNEKDKTEKNKENDSGLVTRESIGAVGALFSALAFFILCTRSLIFGGIGIAVNSFLLGTFGYLAFPVLLAAIYLSVTVFLDKRFIRNRKAVAMISAAVVCAMLILHSALTYSWELSGYLTRCFRASSAGNHGIDSCTPAGWLGALLVFPIAKLTTKIGAIVIFTLLLLTFVYLSVFFLFGKSFPRRAAKKPNAAKSASASTGKRPAAPAAPAETMAQRGQYAYPAQNMQGMPAAASEPRYAQPSVPPQGNVYPPYAGGYAGEYAVPEVRQRPGVSLPNDRGQAPAPSVNNGQNNGAYSPFGGTSMGMQQTGFAPEYPQGFNALPPEEPMGRDFLFGSTPAEIYRKNLIFDSNANVNKRPPADPDQPTVYSGSFAKSYSAAYEDSVNGGNDAPRPPKIVTDTTKESGNYNSYSDYAEPFGNGRAEQDSDTVAPRQPIEPMPAFTPQPEFSARPEPEIYRETPPVVRPYPTESVMPEPPAQPSGQPIVEPEETEERESSRPRFMDIFSTSNPNIYGLQDDTASDRDIFSRGEERNGDVSEGRRAERDFGLSDRWSDDRGEQTEETRGSRRDLFETENDDFISGREGRLNDRESEKRDRDLFGAAEEDPYSLRSDNSRSSESRETESRFSEPSRIDEEPMGRNRRDIFDEEPEDILGGDRGRDSFEPAEQIRETPPQPEVPPVVQPKPQPRPEPPKPRIRRPYRPVPLDYFDCRDVEPDANAEEVENIKQTIVETLDAFKVTDSTVASVTYGPTVTRYNVVIPRNISARKVVALDQEIAMNLYASQGVNIYPNFEDGAVSIEVPNRTRQFVQLGCMLTGNDYVNAKPSSLVFAMGKDVANRKVYGDICKMTHLLVAGSSGAGKSVFLGSLIISLIAKYSPEQLRLILIDPKKTEFVIYNGLPHLMINEIITDVNKTIQSLNWAIGEMNRRYDLFEQMSRSGTYVVNIDEYNSNLPAGEDKLPKIVIIVDELADLMLAAKKEIEDRIQNLTQKSRAAGIHLIVATQRPSADVITGVIKGNLATRIAFMVASDVDSRVILDGSGAQKLLGKGDMLYTMAGINTPVRVQSAFISSEDSQKVVNYIKSNNEAHFDESATAYINNARASGVDDDGESEECVEEVYIDALRFIIQSGSASISMIQRKCSVGYNKAGKIIEWMEDMGYISAFDGAKARKVLLSKEDFESKYGPL